MEPIKLWNKLCNTLEDAAKLHPLLFGPRMELFNSKKTERSLKDFILLHVFYKYSLRKKVEINFSTYNKLIYYINSPSIASIGQAKELANKFLINDKGQNIVFIVSSNIKKFHSDWLKELSQSNIQWIYEEATPSYNSILKLISLAYKSYKLTFKLKYKLEKENLLTEINFDFNKITLFFFQDLVTFDSLFFLLKRGGKPKCLISASDMVAKSHAVHALFSSKNIPNFVYQHGTIGILQSRHYPGTKSIVWGIRHKEYLNKININFNSLVIGSLRFSKIYTNKKDSNKKKNFNRQILFIPTGIESISRTITNDYLNEYKLGLIYIFKQLSKDFEIKLRLRPTGKINSYWNGILSLENVSISDTKSSLYKNFESADLCITDFSTAGYEAMLHNKPCLFFYPYSKKDPLYDMVGINVPEQTYCKPNDIVDEVYSILSDQDYYNSFSKRQKGIVEELFVSKEEMEDKFKAFINS